MTFATQLKQARKRAGLSAQQAADLLGVTRAAIYHWENGRREPPVDPVPTQADILAVIKNAPPKRG